MRIMTVGACAAILVGSAVGARAQSWQDAYDRRDYATAAARLQASVFEHPTQGHSRYPDLDALRTLAQMYADGRGVPQDALTACTLSNLGSGAAVYRHGDRDARTLAIQRQVEAHCMPLTPDERRVAMEPESCVQPGPSPAVLFSSATRRIELGRSRLTVVDRGRARDYALAPLLRCAQQVPAVRHVRVAGPKNSGIAAREFVEVYSWHSSMKDGNRIRTLEWSVIELTPQTPALRARAVLEQAVGSAWPANPLPPQFSQGVTFSMHQSGDVRWQMRGQPAVHGVIGRPGALRASSQTR